MAARLLTLDEVKNSDNVYLLYQKEDPVVHLFDRTKTHDEFISFYRKDERFMGVSVQPHLWIDKYGKEWFAFDSEPDYQQVMIKKGLMSDYA